jgi:hypothetical protein
MNNTIKIELTQQQLQIISSALCELPFRVVAPVIDSINNQIINKQEFKSSQPLDENGIEIK